MGQIHGRYILADSPDGLVIVDPHAAQERFFYEEMKADFVAPWGKAQLSLLKTYIEISEEDYDILINLQTALFDWGFQYQLSETECQIISVPAIFSQKDPRDLFSDLLSFAKECPESPVQELLINWRDQKMAGWACRKSIFLGQKLSLEEMNALLRQIEQNPLGSRCNHGRPVYRILSIRELNNFFER